MHAETLNPPAKARKARVSVPLESGILELWVVSVAEGQPGAPKKYSEGCQHISILLPVSLVRKLEEFCARFHMSKTDALGIALNYCAMSEAEREAELREAAFELEALKKEMLGKDEELARLSAQLCALQQRAVCTIRSTEAEGVMAETRRLLHEGRMSPSALNFRINTMLRPFLDGKIPEGQKSEIRGFISSVQGAEIPSEKREKSRIELAEGQGKKLGATVLPAGPVFYDFTKKDEQKRDDAEYEKLMSAAEKSEGGGGN